MLYGLLAAQRATFAKVTSDEGGAPSFVDRSFERFLRCGVLAHGFARFQCDTCEHHHFVPLSCKRAGSVERLVLDVYARVMRLLDKQGLLQFGADDALSQDAPALSACYEGAVPQRVDLGPLKGRPVMKLGASLSRHLASGW